MPQRRRTGLTLATLAVVASAAAGCSIEISPKGMQAPFSIAPIPSASATQPGYICTAVYKIITDGAVTLAEYVGGNTDANTKGMRDTLSDMSTQVTAEGAKAADDTRLQTAIDDIAGSLSTGSQAADPRTYINGDFQTVGQKLDGTCQ